MSLIVNVTNIPAPYREKIHELISGHFKGSYTVIYCAEREPNRHWKIKYGNYAKIFLAGNSTGYIHNNISVWNKLNLLKPKYVITTGFNPTMLYAFIWCMRFNAKHICFTDGTLKSEQSLSWIHRFVRKIVYAKSVAFIASSDSGISLYRNYNIVSEKIFKSVLCVDNISYQKKISFNKQYDLMFSGQFIDRKMPFFFVAVARLIKVRLGTCKVLMLGNGPLQKDVIEELENHGIQFEYPGYVQQEELPQYFQKAKIFLFPTQNDPWGIVANEAMAAGLPVITCENAGAAHDLVIHNKNGYVLPLNPVVWADHVVGLLTNQNLYNEISQNALADVQKFNFTQAAAGIISAVNSVGQF